MSWLNAQLHGDRVGGKSPNRIAVWIGRAASLERNTELFDPFIERTSPMHIVDQAKDRSTFSYAHLSALLVKRVVFLTSARVREPFA